VKILVSGATGLVGKAVVPMLVAAGHDVRALSRGEKGDRSIVWNVETGELDQTALQKFGAPEAIIHLAGENIAARRWSAKQKARIRDSRVEATRELTAFLARNVPTLKVFVGASAIGFYGDRGDEVLTEQSARGEGFLPDVCEGWESAAEPLAAAGVRVAHLRFGIILSREGGALAKMLPVFRSGLGGRMGNGEQWMSWISIEDAVRMIEFALMEESVAGACNAVAPEAVRNKEFTATLARHLKRPAVLPLPAAVVRMVFGEMGNALLLSSARVVPERLERAGFEFRHLRLEEALRAVLEKN
jgi:uncharacterized protein (TIGR01777 family)